MSWDVIIIGGGMAGISLAARISGHCRVVLLEAETHPGYHSTGRSAALYEPNYGNAVIKALTVASGDFFHDPSDFGESSYLSPRGVLTVATEGELPLLAQMEAEGAGLSRISAEEARDRFPILRPEKIAAALYGDAAEDIDVDRMLQAFLRRARYNGASVITKARVEVITRDDIWRVTAAGEVFEAPIIVNAAGAWADTVAVMAGARPRRVQPLRRSAALIPAPEGMDVSTWPMLMNAAETFYAKPDAGRLLVSPADADPVEPMDAWPDDMVLAEGLDRFEQAVTLPVTRLERSWAGLRSFAPDRTPVVGFDKEKTGFFWLAGQGGYGIQTAPALSRLAAQLLLGRPVTLCASHVPALSPNRF